MYERPLRLRIGACCFILFPIFPFSPSSTAAATPLTDSGVLGGTRRLLALRVLPASRGRGATAIRGAAVGPGPTTIIVVAPGRRVLELIDGVAVFRHGCRKEDTRMREGKRSPEKAL
jgi:hypothetical protein